LEVLEQGIPFSAASRVRTSHIDGRQLCRWNDVTNEPGSCLPSNWQSGANPTTNRGIRYTVGRSRIQPAASKQWTWTRAAGAGGAEPAIFRFVMASSPYMRCGERNKVKYLFGRVASRMRQSRRVGERKWLRMSHVASRSAAALMETEHPSSARERGACRQS